jgi:hypothetical protein
MNVTELPMFLSDRAEFLFKGLNLFLAQEIKPLLLLR